MAGRIDQDKALALAASGACVTEMAKTLDVSLPAVLYWEKRAGVVVARARRGSKSLCADTAARAEKMTAMYRQGLTLEVIGQKFGVTRERVRQILKSHGVEASEGGKSKAARMKATARQQRRVAASLAKFGLGPEEMQRWRKNGVLRAYVMQVKNADARAIGWRLTFAQWLAIWLESGKLEQRGRGKGRYVMSRVNDSGAYEIGNVHIQHSVDNSFEAVRKWAGRTKANRGVYCLYPGSKKPWLAKVGKVRLGMFATEQDAVNAREAYFAAHPEIKQFRSSSGIYAVRYGRFQAWAGSRYLGTYRTREEAEAVRATALELKAA